jgi:spore germination protein YaaH
LTPTRPTGFRLAALIAVLAILGGATTQASPAKRISGNLVFWDQSRGFDAIRANADLFSEISPFWYTVDADGRVVPFTTEAGAPYVDPSILSFLRGNGILVIPTVANILNGVWNGALVSRVIASPTLAAANIANLVQLAVTEGYDGIDLDYENLGASDRPAFTDFVNRLADALHASGKLLTVNVYAKTSEPGTWGGPQAQDWWAIGQAADQVRIMTYEYHWATSGPGPISPITWVNDVLAFARSTMSADKVMQGVPLYGYDWVGQSGVDIVWEQATALAKQYGATIAWDAASASPWFEYRAKGARHTVWFENGSSVDAKLQANAASGAAGVTLWRLGGQDPAVWSALRTRFGGTGSITDSVPPSVSISSPSSGATVQKTQRVEAVASDNVGVVRVEFYVNGTRLATDTAAPYVAYWDTRRLAPGAYVITAVAYDASGNSATASVTANR